MLKETKILFNKIKTFRQLLTEAVSDEPIIKAIQNYEYVYIYYEGDTTVEKGYRTIRPYVLGVHKKSGNKVVRAWQDKGKSDSLRADSPRKRHGHEYHTDTDGKTKAGWRLFRLDKITSIYPTGSRFVDKEGKVLIPSGTAKYKQDDADMSTIIASISPETPSKYISGIDSIEKPDVVGDKVDKSHFNTQSKRFKQFYNVNKNKKEATANDIENLYNIAKKVMKKSPNRYVVAINNLGNFKLVDIKNKQLLPPESIVGDLSNLYSKFILSKKPVSQKDNTFFKSSLDKLNKENKK